MITGHKNHENNGYPSITFAGRASLNEEVGNIAVAVLFADKDRVHALKILAPDGSEFVLPIKKEASSEREGVPEKTVPRTPTELTSGSKIPQITANSQVQSSYEQKSVRDGENPYNGKSLDKDSDVYDYDYMVSLPDMVVHEMPQLVSVKTGNKVDQSKAVQLGLENASTVGRKVADNAYAIRNVYTGREIILGRSGLGHGLEGGDIKRLRTNARLSAIGGNIVQNAIPVNGLKNKNSQAKGTYAMACLLKSGDMDVVAIVTVEEHESKAIGIDYVDITHAIGGRIMAKKEGSLSSTREKGYKNYPAPNAATFSVSIADFLAVVNDTHRSILSEDVLNHFGESALPMVIIQKEFCSPTVVTDGFSQGGKTKKKRIIKLEP